jgi:fatty-acyl-CoA synthase
VPDAKWGEAPRAVVVSKPGARAETEELLAFAGQRLARFKLPRSIIVVEALPRTAAGKIDKERLKKVHGGA